MCQDDAHRILPEPTSAPASAARDAAGSRAAHFATTGARSACGAISRGKKKAWRKNCESVVR